MPRIPALKAVYDEIMSDETRGTRVFDSDFSGTEDDHWGLPLEMPEWLNRVHNARAGRTFIFGTGPSLVSQLHLLGPMKSEFTWSVNRMRWFKDRLPFTPDCHVLAEPGPILEWGASVGEIYDYPEAPVRIAINWWPVTAPGWLWCPKAPDDVQTRWQGNQGLGERLAPLPTAWASPLTLAQLVLWFGFTEIFLLGCDTTQTGQAWDVEHGRTKQPRSIVSILESADRLRMDVQRAGRRVFDCTPGGRLNQEGVLEYVELADVL